MPAFNARLIVSDLNAIEPLATVIIPFEDESPFAVLEPLIASLAAFAADHPLRIHHA